MFGNVLQGPAPQVLEHDDFALRLGQGRQRVGQSEHLFVALGRLAGRSLICGQPAGHSRRGAIQVGFQRPLQVHGPLVAVIVLDHVGQCAGKDAPQPGEQHRPIRVLQRRPGRVGAQKRLLHHVGRIELAAQARIEMDTRQHFQIRPERLQGLRRIRGHASILERRHLQADKPRPSEKKCCCGEIISCLQGSLQTSDHLWRTSASPCNRSATIPPRSQ
jgi:hypothetical protein